ncbi:MAG: PA2779 family protein [bacterium]|nr:PA2779 family protein [bacterium]
MKAGAVGACMLIFAGDAVGAVPAVEPQLHVVGADEILVRIDQQSDQADADREAIQALLQREDVRRIAGAAGLDLERASAAASVLSGEALATLAAQASSVDEGLAGGEGNVVISTTAIIIILLILILLVN